MLRSMDTLFTTSLSLATGKLLKSAPRLRNTLWRICGVARDIRSTLQHTTGNDLDLRERNCYGTKLMYCGSLRIGTGDPSDMLNTRTKGSKPIIPEAARFIEVSTNSITLHLSAWSDGGCPMLYFVVEHKKK